MGVSLKQLIFLFDVGQTNFLDEDSSGWPSVVTDKLKARMKAKMQGVRHFTAMNFNKNVWSLSIIIIITIIVKCRSSYIFNPCFVSVSQNCWPTQEFAVVNVCPLSFLNGHSVDYFTVYLGYLSVNDNDFALKKWEEFCISHLAEL